MKVLLINGSPHKEGCTYTALKEVADTLEDIVFNYRAYGLPCFETIRRARQRVQSLFPEYSRNPQKEEQSGSISIVINIS